MGGGTGFFFSDQGETYLVSNRHVFSPGEFTPLEIRIWLRDYGNATNARSESVELYDSGSAKWYGHPDSDEIDVAVLPLNRVLSAIDDVKNGTSKTGSIAFTEEYFLPEVVSLNGSEVILGYPGDFFDQSTKFPVKRNAVLSSPYGLDFDGKPCFVTDARMHPGTSGSPIILNYPLMHREGYNLPDNRNKSLYLLGVHSATYYELQDQDDEDDDEDSDMVKWRYDLNLGWYPELIIEILESI